MPYPRESSTVTPCSTASLTLGLACQPPICQVEGPAAGHSWDIKRQEAPTPFVGYEGGMLFGRTNTWCALSKEWAGPMQSVGTVSFATANAFLSTQHLAIVGRNFSESEQGMPVLGGWSLGVTAATHAASISRMMGST